MSPGRGTRASHIKEEIDVENDARSAHALAARGLRPGRPKRDVASADSLNRDLQLAPVDTRRELNDRPSARHRHGPRAGPRARPEARPRQADAQAEAGSGAALRRPAAAAPAPPRQQLRRESRRRHQSAAATDAEIRSQQEQGGRHRSRPRSRNDVKDAAGRVVIPAGSEVTLQVTAIKESENKSDTTGTLTLQPTSVVHQRSVVSDLPASISG